MLGDLKAEYILLFYCCCLVLDRQLCQTNLNNLKADSRDRVIDLDLAVESSCSFVYWLFVNAGVWNPLISNSWETQFPKLLGDWV